jgi:acetolactate synthase-1/2/3 large subunit
MSTKKEWLDKCLSWKEKWPVHLEQGDKLNDDSNGINLYKFIEVLNQNLKEDSVITWDAGSSLYVTNQALRLNGKNQRSIGSLAQAEMGAALGIAAGVSFAKNKGEVICVVGDGSFNTNPQALAIIRKHNLPVKIFVLNNGGYLSIKNSQDKFYEGRRIGTDFTDGLFFPRLLHLSKAYNINYITINSINEIDRGIKAILSISEPIICEVICQELQEISPGITASKNADGKLEQCGFENMAPFIKDIEKEMI